MDEIGKSDDINHDRRRFVGTAAAGIAAAGAGGLFPENLAAASESDSIRSFQFTASEEDLADLRRRINATKWPEREQVADDIAGRAARDDAEARALLGDGLRLAQGARRS